MFDLTKSVILEEQDLKIYRKLRLVLFSLSLLGFFYVAYLIMFPTQSFVFSFLNPDASSNTITRPRSDNGALIKNGKISANNNLSFDTSLVGNYSKAQLTFILSKKSEKPKLARLQAVRSYQAFLYPAGSPLGFKDGSLLKNSQNYYIVSTGELHKFQSFYLAASFGFSEKSFREVEQNDLQYNISGFPIIDEKKFPDASLFKIGSDFYLLKDSKLQKFLSPEAFLSQYTPEQAIEEEASFINEYQIAESLIGFSDGSLISYADAVYVISEGKNFPIDSVITFEAAGYSWEDVIPVSADEISFYKKAKLFTLRDPHPAGTIFSTIESGEFYLIRDGKKDTLPTANIALSWLRKNPILVSEFGPNFPIFCAELKRNILTLRQYTCEIETGQLDKMVGKDYEFSASFENNVEFDGISVKFEKNITADNFRQSVSEILNRIKNNYVQQ